ncbi:MAG TPA: chorismate-binding protein [Wenzhouxiangella sp.]|nr:chorismate-binding protein [Wenzhouxiangella sp.]
MSFSARELKTPVSLLAVHRHQPGRWPFLLESSAGSPQQARWSLLLRVDNQQPSVLPAASSDEDCRRFFAALDSFPPCFGHKAARADLPFQGGWFLYLGYELAAAFSPGLNLPPADDGLPLAYAQRCRSALLHDRLNGRFWLVAENAPLLEEAHKDLRDCPKPEDQVPQVVFSAVRSDPEENYALGVERVHEHIRCGDVAQVNLSRGWRAVADQAPDAAALYARLIRSSPAPFGALARLPAGTIVSSSPERFIKIDDSWLEARPIGGTRPRSADAQRDRALREELMSSVKERAEHAMLVDLARGDMSRVCRAGSIVVDELMVMESYAHLHHVVSSLRGRLREDASLFDVVRATFPGGSITGCPKRRCMEIIAALEAGGRGHYTGALGYLSNNGNLDLSILIRTLLVRGDEIHFRTGAGIVQGSEAAAEIAETEIKARGLLEAIGHE